MALISDVAEYGGNHSNHCDPGEQPNKRLGIQPSKARGSARHGNG
jgi:hypothetical protein